MTSFISMIINVIDSLVIICIVNVYCDLHIKCVDTIYTIFIINQGCPRENNDRRVYNVLSNTRGIGGLYIWMAIQNELFIRK